MSIELVSHALERLPLPLLDWYRENARVLPWRSDPTPYHVWVSEIMLQQTRVSAVLDYYRRFLDALPAVEDLAAVEEDRLLKLWQGLGYYNRARNLQKAARQVAADFGGVFPGAYEDLLTLAGVGEYTAGAIASIAFGVSVPAVDGNVLRVVSRLTGDRGDVGRPETRDRMRRALLEVIPKKWPGEFNQAMMDLGAMVCLPNGAPLCQKCPLKDFCISNSQNLWAELPVKTAKKPRKIEKRTVFLVFFQHRVALRRRTSRGLLAGLWEYPNEPSPAPCPVEAADLEPGGTGRHIFTHMEWHMDAVVVRAASAALPEGWVWADRAALEGEYALPSAFSCFSHIVEKHL